MALRQLQKLKGGGVNRQDKNSDKIAHIVGNVFEPRYWISTPSQIAFPTDKIGRGDQHTQITNSKSVDDFFLPFLPTKFLLQMMQKMTISRPRRCDTNHHCWDPKEAIQHGSTRFDRFPIRGPWVFLGYKAYTRTRHFKPIKHPWYNICSRMWARTLDPLILQDLQLWQCCLMLKLMNSSWNLHQQVSCLMDATGKFGTRTTTGRRRRRILLFMQWWNIATFANPGTSKIAVMTCYDGMITMKRFMMIYPG